MTESSRPHIEGECLEYKSELRWGSGYEYQIVKSVVAFANTNGGDFIIGKFIGDERKLDSANLDDLINKYVSPRVEGIESAKGANDDWTISVPPSQTPPHIFEHQVAYKADGKLKSHFHPGQIYVRHGSKTEPANGDDVRRIKKLNQSTLLRQLGESIKQFSVSLSASETAIPVQVADGSSAISLKIEDPIKLYPLTTSQVASEIGFSQNWTAQLIKVLKIKLTPSCCLQISYGKARLYKYSGHAVKVLKEFLRVHPNFHPYRDKLPLGQRRSGEQNEP